MSLVIPTAEGRRFGPSISAIPTAERRKAAIVALIHPAYREEWKP